MVYNPNFPPSLSITPNVGHDVLRHDDGDVFGVEAQREAISRYGIAGRVWEAAYTLCAYVDPDNGDGRDSAVDFDPPFMENLHEPLGMIELGSGTGVVAASVAAAIERSVSTGTRLGGFVIATDLPDVCPLLQRNLGMNTSRSTKVDAVFVRPLAWGNLDNAVSIAREFASHRLTHVLCSDLVYFPELFGPLLRTLIHITSPPCAPWSGPSVKIVISYKIRSLAKETLFWSALGLWFSFRPVLARCRAQSVESENASPDDGSGAPDTWRQFGAHEDTDRTFVFVAHRRSESIAWHVPESDKELMEGVGARGTPTKKGDDTFETILLMSIGIDNTGE